MPWNSSDAKSHTSKADTLKKQKQWSNIANSVLEKCLADGGDQKTCESKAITQASGVIAKLSEDVDKSYNYLVDISDIQLEEKEGKKTSWIEIFREGSWSHPKHGIILGTKKLFNDFIDNFKNKVLGREVAIDKTHDPSEGATGWIKEMKIKEDKLLALIEWTPWGIELIEQKGFKYFSPEYRDSYIDKESGKEYKNVLFGGGITNRPFLTNLAPIVLSEDMDVFQKCENTELSDDFKEELWKSFEEHMDHDEDKIKNIMDAMQEHMKEAMAEMKSDNGKIYVKNIIRNHMQAMMNEIMNDMVWSKSVKQVEAKSIH